MSREVAEVEAIAKPMLTVHPRSQSVQYNVYVKVMVRYIPVVEVFACRGMKAWVYWLSCSVSVC